MSALNTLSTAANVTQIIGFADTVFHAGKAVYELFDKARTASRNIALLLLELQALLNVVAFVHVVISEHAQSAFALEDGHTLPNVHTILTLINRDFLHLKGLISQSAASGFGSWFDSFQNNLRWAWNDHEVVAARERLARYTQNLGAALSVAGRRNDIVLRNKVQDIEKKLQTIAQMNPLQPLGITASSKALPKRQHQKVLSRPNPPKDATDKLKVRSSVSGKNHKLSTSTTVFHQEANSIQHDVSKTLVFPETSHEFHIPVVSTYELPDERIFVDTSNHGNHDLAKAVLMLQDPINTALSHLESKVVNGVSKSQAHQLRMLFDFMTASVLVDSAASITSKYGGYSNAIHPSSHFPTKMFTKSRKPTENIQQTQVRRQDRPSNWADCTFLEKQTATLKTSVGFVDACMVFSRSPIEVRLLCCQFQYHGCPTLGLKPFKGDFKFRDCLACPAVDQRFSPIFRLPKPTKQMEERRLERLEKEMRDLYRDVPFIIAPRFPKIQLRS